MKRFVKIILRIFALLTAWILVYRFVWNRSQEAQVWSRPSAEIAYFNKELLLIYETVKTSGSEKGSITLKRIEVTSGKVLWEIPVGSLVFLKQNPDKFYVFQKRPYRELSQVDTQTGGLKTIPLRVDNEILKAMEGPTCFFAFQGKIYFYKAQYEINRGPSSYGDGPIGVIDPDAATARVLVQESNYLTEALVFLGDQILIRSFETLRSYDLKTGQKRYHKKSPCSRPLTTPSGSRAFCNFYEFDSSNRYEKWAEIDSQDGKLLNYRDGSLLDISDEYALASKDKLLELIQLSTQKAVYHLRSSSYFLDAQLFGPAFFVFDMGSHQLRWVDFQAKQDVGLNRISGHMFCGDKGCGFSEGILQAPKFYDPPHYSIEPEGKLELYRMPR